jgi:uncharacterized protein (TIGR03790 family)
MALTPEDLIVVFNLNIPESRQVAIYYAQKRQIPLKNLVGVKVSRGEDMSRTEYEQQLLPPLRQKVAELRRIHKNPAIVLVYGIPLRVGEAALTTTEQDMQALVRVQAERAALQGWGKLEELKGLLTRMKLPEPSHPPHNGPSTQEVLKLAAELLPRAHRFLQAPPESNSQKEERTRVATLTAELSGPLPDLGKKSGNKGKKESGPDDVQLPGIAPVPQKAPALDASLAGQARDLGGKVRRAGGLLEEIEFWENVKRIYGQRRTGASVDSELTLVLYNDYPRVHWLPNPLQVRFDKGPDTHKYRQNVVMVGRLDGPNPEIARRLVDDALETEGRGLQGTCYLDARGLKGEIQVGGYAWFDAHLVRLANMIRELSNINVVLDQTPGLFLRGSCPQAALYCGWYSLAKYVASCTWQKGSVAYHVASSEATTLRKPGSQVWCKRLLEEGVAATLGPVSEPYLLAFPLPDEFFPLLMTGNLTLLEVYFRTVPHLSWQMVLIGDPLYTPFKKIRPGGQRRD